MSNVDPQTLDNATINEFTYEEEQKLNEAKLKFQEENRGHRLGLNPQYRLPFFMFSGGMVTGLNGLVSGFKSAGLKYLASNSHRLPTTTGGWYYYHKRKNYVCYRDAMTNAFKRGISGSLLIGSLFGMEALLDELRGTIDFANTTMAATLAGWVYSNVYKVGHSSAKSLMKKGFQLGLGLGLAQDLLRFVKGDDLWYLRVMGVRQMPLKERLNIKRPEDLESV